MSGEHVISNAVFAAGCGCPVVVEGVKRIQGGAPTRGAEKANILCSKHNSLLAPLDSTAGEVSAFLHNSSQPEFKDNLFIEGELLERWVLKTVINFAVSGWAHRRKWRPEADIVEAIFGLAPIPEGCGLYSVDGIRWAGNRPGPGVTAEAITELRPDGPALLGGYVSLHGMPLFGSFHYRITERLEASKELAIHGKFGPGGLRHLYHPGAIVSERKKGGMVYIALSWGGEFRHQRTDQNADGELHPKE
ncbi:MAG: hypothetical protein ACRDRQ_24455 [Pseudonocardiaceae bacterium]